MRDVNSLHPLVKMQAQALVSVCMKHNIYIKITDCVRTKAEQDDCIRRGTSSVDWYHTHHAYGLAFDICINDKNDPYPKNDKLWKKIGEFGKNLGLTPGVFWDKPDRPHYQLNAFGLANDLIKTYGGPNGFLKHKDFKIKTPKTPIVPTSSKKKIMWLQTRLCIAGFTTTIDGVWGNETTNQLKAYWKKTTGKKCIGKLCSVGCIKLLS